MPRDIEKQKAAKRKHYITNRDSVISRTKQRAIYLRNKLTEYMKDKSCEICGENRRPTLDFDHIDPTQKFDNIANMIKRRFTWDKILLEIEKCRILCSNCHRVHTAEQLGHYKDYTEELKLLEAR